MNIELFRSLGTEETCTHDALKAASDTCSFAREHCHPESVINFNTFYYCTLEERLGIMVPLILIFLTLCFYVLSTTASSYLAPSVIKIVEILRISQSLASVLFAITNGLPDIFGSIIATQSPESGISLALGNLLGSSFILATFTIGILALLQRTGVKLRMGTFLRDSIFLLVGLITIVVYGVLGEVNYITGIVFFIEYFVYTVVVIVVESKASNLKIITRDSFSQDRASQQARILSPLKFQDDLLSIITPPKTVPINNASYELQFQISEVSKNRHTIKGKRRKYSHDQEIEIGQNLIIEDYIEQPDDLPIMSPFGNRAHEEGTAFKRLSYQMILHIFKARFFFQSARLSKKKWEDLNCCRRTIVVLLEVPLDIVRRLTIPSIGDENWNRGFTSLNPPFMIFFIFFSLKQLDFRVNEVRLFWPMMLASIPICVLLFFTSHSNKAPRYSPILCFIAFFMSMLWLWFLSNILIDLLHLFQYISGVGSSYLGLTLFGIGLTLPELFTFVALSHVGMNELGISSCLSSSVFNVILGSAATFLKTGLDFGTSQFGYDQRFKIIPVSSALLLAFFMIIFLIWLTCRKFFINSAVAIYLIVAYVIFVIFATVIAIIQP